MKRIALYSIIMIMFVSCGFMSFEGLEYPNISGQVFDRNNQPIGNVKVYITDNYNKRFNDLSYFTDSEGRFFVKACIVKKAGICFAFDGHFIRIHTEKNQDIKMQMCLCLSRPAISIMTGYLHKISY